MADSINAEGWIRDKKERDAVFEAQNTELLGPERAVFATAMAGCRDVLDAVFADGSVEQLDAKANIAIAESGFDLIWSAWRDMLAARYTASTSKWRTISEAREFLGAITVQPALGEDWFAQRMTVATARRALRNALKDQGHTELANEWLRDRAEDSKPMQALAHVTVQACAVAVPLEFDENDQPVSFLVGGIADERLARLIGVFLANEALMLVQTCVFAFQHLERVGQLWTERISSMHKQNVAELMQVYEGDAFKDALRKAALAVQTILNVAGVETIGNGQPGVSA